VLYWDWVVLGKMNLLIIEYFVGELSLKIE